MPDRFPSLDRLQGRLLMQVNAQAKEDPSESVDLNRVADLVGLPRDRCELIAEHLHQYGLLKIESRLEGFLVSITVPGIDEARRLGLPLWRRLGRDPVWRAAFIGALLSGLVTQFLNWLFR
jgi:hypothetical protein